MTDYFVSWNGSIDRQTVAAQQQPAPKFVPAPPASHVLLMALFEAQPHRHWTHAELARATDRDRTTIHTALRRAIAAGDVMKVQTGLNPQMGATVRFTLARRRTP